ncbi:MAG: FAD-dependent oxidoreductase [Acidimicrobiales bacterium]|nr:FAD-dependent oxidoreductase [Acidimicrobiales bacterium]
MSRSVTVLGGGVAGLSTALLLARDGHRVILTERDAFELGEPLDAPAWERRGIPHFLQPHAFIPRGRVEMIDELPDVYDALLTAGAHDVDIARKLSGQRQPGDERLQYVAARRPLIEWALRRAAAREPGIDIRPRTTAERHDAVDAEIVVDAMGRRTPTPKWFADSSEPLSSDCGVVYLCRYYRQRPGFQLPDGPWLLGPRGDLGYLGYATFPGDNGTFSALLAIPSGVAEWRELANEDRFERALQTIPLLRRWVDPEGVEPITRVMPMAGLRNSLRFVDPSSPFVPVGDALAHTDPTLAHGLSFALIHARALRDVLRGQPSRRDVLGAYLAAVIPAARERYSLATALDEQRRRVWRGESVDFTRHDGGAYELFSIVAAGAAALADDDVLRIAVRRSGLLDRTSALDDDVLMQERITAVFAELLSTPGPRPGPEREEMAEIAAGTATPLTG